MTSLLAQLYVLMSFIRESDNKVVITIKSVKYVIITSLNWHQREIFSFINEYCACIVRSIEKNGDQYTKYICGDNSTWQSSDTTNEIELKKEFYILRNVEVNSCRISVSLVCRIISRSIDYVSHRNLYKLKNNCSHSRRA
jgi:hypothetical protein